MFIGKRSRVIALFCIALSPGANADGCFDPQSEPGDRVSACQEAAAEGNIEAQYRLGSIFREGEGTPADPQRAVRWYTAAATAGLAEAQYSLGMLYEAGEGVTKDETRAAQWYLKAAEQGNADAQWLLGSMYEFGRGVVRDPVQAHMWYSLSAAAGNPYGKNRKAAVSIMMTPEQLSQSRIRFEAWSEANWWVAPATAD